MVISNPRWQRGIVIVVLSPADQSDVSPRGSGVSITAARTAGNKHAEDVPLMLF
jgi:hypothetical protein